MAESFEKPEDEIPLDPAMERVRRKLARLMAVSIGVMLVGLMAVLGAVVYKSSNGSAPPEMAEALLVLPDDFRVTDTAISENRVMFFGTTSSSERQIVIFDARTGEKVGHHRIK